MHLKDEPSVAMLYVYACKIHGIDNQEDLLFQKSS